MTESELKTLRDHDETMRRLRAEFATQVWPKIEREIVKPFSPTTHQAAWLAFVAGRKTPTANAQ